MAVENCRKRLRDEGTCPVCLGFLTAPVTLDCGHNFCHACIVRSWKVLPEASCPQCRDKVQAKKLRPNRQLANMMEIAKDLSNLLTHHVVPLEVDAKECKVQISRSLEFLRKERGNILAYKAKNEKESQDQLKQMEAERERTAAAFSQLRQFLEEQETLLQTQMKEVEKEIERQRDEHLATLSAELTSLDNLIRELEEKQQQSANELLQDFGDTMERCKRKSFENPVTFSVAQKWRIHDFFDINPYLEALMKQFKESLVSGFQLQEVHVILDPDTAHPNLILSDDRKSVREGDVWQVLPENPERFDHWPFVLGCERFTSGRHFWEVAVGSLEEWSVGVAKKSVRRKGDDDTGHTGIWDFGMWDGEYRVSLSLDVPPLSLIRELRRIRVMLNCAAGRVAFFDADTGAQLYAYSDASFCGETLLPFFWVSEEAQLTICP